MQVSGCALGGRVVDKYSAWARAWQALSPTSAAAPSAQWPGLVPKRSNKSMSALGTTMHFQKFSIQNLWPGDDVCK